MPGENFIQGATGGSSYRPRYGAHHGGGGHRGASNRPSQGPKRSDHGRHYR
jgi:hypothetical protein